MSKISIDINTKIENNFKEDEEKNFDSYNLINIREEKKSCFREDLSNLSRNCEKKLATSEFSINENDKPYNNFDKSSNCDVDPNTRDVIIEKNETATICRGCIIY